MDRIWHCTSPFGVLTLASDGKALTGLWFDFQRHFASTLTKDHREEELPLFRETEKWLNAYFCGAPLPQPPPVSFRGTPFQKCVWQKLLEIPYGETLTYGELAFRIAKEQGMKHLSAQAVGNAVARNPVSLIVPCHRVVGKNGALVGYAAGVEIKRKLLELEKEHK